MIFLGLKSVLGALTLSLRLIVLEVVAKTADVGVGWMLRSRIGRKYSS